MVYYITYVYFRMHFNTFIFRAVEGHSKIEQKVERKLLSVSILCTTCYQS